jgi:capsular exopolysaccharide synthesis family protein
MSHTSLEVEVPAGNQRIGRMEDLIAAMQNPGVADIDTEIDVLRSDMLLSKVASKIYTSVRYTAAEGLKRIEFYKNPPILVNDIRLYDKRLFSTTFIVKVLDENRFRLSYKKSILQKVLTRIKETSKEHDTAFNSVYRFSEPVKGESFSFVVHNTSAKPGETYHFTFYYKPELIKNIKKNLNIKPASARSSVIKITYEDINPYRVRDFLNILTQSYIALNIEKKSKTASSTLAFLDKQLAQIKQELQHSSDLLKRYKERNNFIDIDTKSREIVDKLIDYEKEYAQAKLQYQTFQILKKELRRGNYAAMSGFGRAYPILDNMVQQLQDTQARKAELLINLTPMHPDVVAVERRIVQIKRGIDEVAAGIDKELKQHLLALKRMVSKERAAMKQLPKKEQSLANLERVFGVNEKLYLYLLQRRSELSLLQASKVSDIRVLDKPYVALKPTKPNKTIVLMTSLFLGLLFSFFATFFRFNTKIKSAEDIERNSDIPLLGIIPYVEKRDLYNSAYVLKEPTSTAAEAFRAIRSNLEYIAPATKGGKVILVTSSVPNEGKTVVAANLASVLGMSEKRVIILSLDLRRPELHHKFGLSNKLGISDVLSGKAQIENVVWEHTVYKNLNIVTSGRIPPNPAELLASSKMKKLIEKLKQEYDYVILDTPPINYVADAVALFKYADVILFVVKSDFTDEKYLKAFNEIVNKMKLKHVGIVLNSVKKKYNKLEQFDRKYLYFEP